MRKILLCSIILFIAAAAVWFFGFYPVATVNGTTVFAHTLDERVDAFLYFQGQRGFNASTALIRLGVLDGMVEDIIIRQALEKRGVADADTTAVVEKLLAHKKAVADIAGIAGTYRLEPGAFREMLLEPQARLYTVRSFFESEEQFQRWLQAQKQAADVSLYISSWRWANGGIRESEKEKVKSGK